MYASQRQVNTRKGVRKIVRTNPIPKLIDYQCHDGGHTKYRSSLELRCPTKVLTTKTSTLTHVTLLASFSKKSLCITTQFRTHPSKPMTATLRESPSLQQIASRLERIPEPWRRRRPALSGQTSIVYHPCRPAWPSPRHPSPHRECQKQGRVSSSPWRRRRREPAGAGHPLPRRDPRLDSRDTRRPRAIVSRATADGFARLSGPAAPLASRASAPRPGIGEHRQSGSNRGAARLLPLFRHLVRGRLPKPMDSISGAYDNIHRPDGNKGVAAIILFLLLFLSFLPLFFWSGAGLLLCSGSGLRLRLLLPASSAPLAASFSFASAYFFASAFSRLFYAS